MWWEPKGAQRPCFAVFVSLFTFAPAGATLTMIPRFRDEGAFMVSGPHSEQIQIENPLICRAAGGFFMRMFSEMNACPPGLFGATS